MSRLDFITYKPTDEEWEYHKQKVQEEERIQYIIDHRKELEANAAELGLNRRVAVPAEIEPPMVRFADVLNRRYPILERAADRASERIR